MIQSVRCRSSSYECGLWVGWFAFEWFSQGPLIPPSLGTKSLQDQQEPTAVKVSEHRE